MPSDAVVYEYMTAKLFITDFDGVICDSVLECLLVTYNAYHSLTTPFFQRVLDLDVIPSEKQHLFRQLRPYLKGAEDFVPMYLAIESGVRIENQNAFNEFRATHADQLFTYQRAFYAERDYLQQNEKEIWLGINPLFEGTKEALQACESFDTRYILTTKRQQDVAEIFAYQQIPFPVDHIVYMKADGKPQKLLGMIREHGATFEETAYVEDQVDFLVRSQQHKIGSYLVEWGYVSEEQKNLARRHNIPIISPPEFVSLLSG
jgi:phosphoglycolate phosphatase-like HAD superfamily hydrolase